MFCHVADELDFMTNSVQKVETEGGSEASTSTPLVRFQAGEKFTFSDFQKVSTWPLMPTQGGDVMTVKYICLNAGIVWPLTQMC